MTASRNLRGRLTLERDGISGYAYDPADLTRRFVVELLIDGLSIATTRAAAFAPEIAAIGDGCYGFGFELPAAVLEAGAGTVEAKLANTGEPVGERLSLASPSTAVDDIGQVTWAGGLRFCGSLPAGSGPRTLVRAVIDGAEVAQASATSWTYRERGSLRRALPAFDLRLPEAFADGHVHRVVVIDDAGRELHGSPCAILAHPDGPRGLFAPDGSACDAARLDLLERLLPRSLPFEGWSAWRRRFPHAPLGERRPVRVAVALVGSDVDASIRSLEAQAGADWTAIQLPDAGGPARFDPVAFADFLTQEADHPTVILALAGVRFDPEALLRLDVAVSGTGASLAYPDVQGCLGRPAAPLLWPAYDEERQLEQGYAALLFAGRSAAVLAALRRGVDSLPALVLALASAGPSTHLPEPLAEIPPLDVAGLSRTLARAARLHLAASGTPAEIRLRPESALPSIHVVRRTARPALSLVVVNPDGREPEGAILARLGASAASQDLMVVTHRPCATPRGWRALVVPGDRNPARLRNAGAAAALGDIVMFLDLGIEPLDADWAAELWGRLSAPAVASVSGVLLGPDGVVLEAGIVLGPEFACAPAYEGLRVPEGGYADGLRIARGCGALGTSCLMVRRSDLMAAGGFDALRFPETHSGVDLSLRLRSRGLRLILTPDACFRRDVAPTNLSPAREAVARENLRNLWGPDLVDDPFYHPALNLDRGPFTGLAWPPRPRRLRGPERPRAGLAAAGA